MVPATPPTTHAAVGNVNPLGTTIVYVVDPLALTTTDEGNTAIVPNTNFAVPAPAFATVTLTFPPTGAEGGLTLMIAALGTRYVNTILLGAVSAASMFVTETGPGMSEQAVTTTGEVMAITRVPETLIGWA
ncbi:MAG TPA: hypothetical protein VEZ11_02350, partial [Thermoanaerobaculia bacterium]|nr:hypothetical protein [Thermoanaerobaculia bacterium]